MIRIMGKIEGVDSILGYLDATQPITIVSAGYEYSKNTYTYERKDERQDWQLIYIIHGSAYNDYTSKYLEQGNLLIFPPHTKRRIIYKNTKHFWIHLSGTNVLDILAETFDFTLKTHDIGYCKEYDDLFLKS